MKVKKNKKIFVAKYPPKKTKKKKIFNNINIKKYRKSFLFTKIISLLIFIFIIVIFNSEYLINNNYLFVGYVIDGRNFYESLISIVSLLENKNKETFINIYIIENFLHEYYIRYLLSLQLKYLNTKITFINNNKDIKNYNDEDKLTLFFKFINYFKHDRILFLNSDTLIFKDLSPLFNLKISKDYFIGPNLSSFKYVLLMNLQKIRNENCFQNCLKTKIDLSFSDENKIEIEKKLVANRIFKKIDASWVNNSKIYNYSELFNTYEFPNIYYFNETQPYLNNFNSIYKNIWHIYANKTGKYNDIIHHFNLSFNINKKTELNIAISINDGYTYQAIVTLTSLFETSSELTKFNIYFVVPNDFSEINKKKILSLLNLYPNKGKIHFILVSNFFPRKVFRSPHPNYYKLYYDKLLPENLEKIIYLEADMIYLEDIRILNDLDINNKTYLGLGTGSYIGTDEFVIAPHIINLKLIRTTNLTNLYSRFLDENYRLIYVDERSINTFNQGRLGRIPIRYSVQDCVLINNYFDKRATYKGVMHITEEEYDSFKDNQAFVHFTGCKPWRNKNRNCKYGKKWWFLAEKSGFKNEMINSFFK